MLRRIGGAGAALWWAFGVWIYVNSRTAGGRDSYMGGWPSGCGVGRLESCDAVVRVVVSEGGFLPYGSYIYTIYTTEDDPCVKYTYICTLYYPRISRSSVYPCYSVVSKEA